MNLKRLLVCASVAAAFATAIPAMADGHDNGADGASSSGAYGTGYRPWPRHMGRYGYQRPYMRPYGPRPPMYRPHHRMPYGRMLPPMRGPMPSAYGAAPQQPVTSAPAQKAVPGAALAGATTAAVVDSAEVSISQMQFKPARITVKKGATVTWTQADRMPHTVTASDGKFESGALSGGATYSQSFAEAGTFSYYCSLHPSMRGEVVVVE